MGLFSFFKNQKNESRSLEEILAKYDEPENTNNTQSNIRTENHHVAGTSFRQKEIKSMSFENEDYRMSKKDFIDFHEEYEKVYALDFSPIKVELIEEPDNEHDSNAIKVIIDDVHVGYIKKGSCTHVKKLLHSNKITSITAEIRGGKYKSYYLEFDMDKNDEIAHIESGKTDYFVTVCIAYKVE